MISHFFVIVVISGWSAKNSTRSFKQILVGSWSRSWLQSSFNQPINFGCFLGEFGPGVDSWVCSGLGWDDGNQKSNQPGPKKSHTDRLCCSGIRLTKGNVSKIQGKGVTRTQDLSISLGRTKNTRKTHKFWDVDDPPSSIIFDIELEPQWLRIAMKSMSMFILCFQFREWSSGTMHQERLIVPSIGTDNYLYQLLLGTILQVRRFKDEKTIK